MDLIISDKWLREYLKTKANIREIAKYLSLCGPSVEKIEKHGEDYLYHIEVTTNRVDAYSVYGIAREACAILPRFGAKASLLSIKLAKSGKKPGSLSFKVSQSDNVLRTYGVILGDIKNRKTPVWMKNRLEMSGVRSINALVDITNYIMIEIGCPMHAFDYDKIKNKQFVIRESRHGEEITSLDGKKYTLPGGDIVFDDGSGKIIDLPGIIGTENSMVDEKTKRVLLFVDINNPNFIRRTSMKLGVRTMAATINEKGVDPEVAETAIKRGVYLYSKVCGARQISKFFDNYPNPNTKKLIKMDFGIFENIIGVSIKKNEIVKILNSLFFEVKTTSNFLNIKVPSFRASDVNLPEDIVEEVARIYGYFNLPGQLMDGAIPHNHVDNIINFERKLKSVLSKLGGVEVYSLSLVSQEMTDGNSLALSNPLGSETAFLRDNLRTSLISAFNENRGWDQKYHLFEIANVYIPQKNSLPNEISVLAGIFSDYGYRKAKGVVETFLEILNIKATFEPSEMYGFSAGRSALIKVKNKIIGKIGVLDMEGEAVYYEFSVESLMNVSQDYKRYKPLPKHPPQIEDLTIELPLRTRVGDVVDFICGFDNVSDAILKDIYKTSFTFRIWYQSDKKTLSNKEVDDIRKKIVKDLSKGFGAKT